MNLDAFWKGLRETGVYETPSSRARDLYTRTLGAFDTLYYIDINLVVVSAFIVARTTGFTHEVWARHGLKMLKAAERAGGKARMENFNSLNSVSLPAVYIANHMSMIETLSLPAALMAFGPLSTVVKTSLLHYALFGAVLRQTHPINVDRKDPREDLRRVLTQGEALLKQGRSVLIFPQHTRMPWFAPAEFNSLGVKLARTAGVPVVPIAVQTDFQGIGRRFRDLGPLDRSRPIRYRIGPPLRVEGNGRQAHADTIQYIRETLTGWGAEVREAPADGKATAES